MPWKSQNTKLWGLTCCILLAAILLSACGPGKATPTVSVDAVYTAAYQTLLAQQATQLALTPPTSTVTPTPPPTLPPPPTAAIPTLAFASPTAGGLVGGGGACDSLAFVSDVNYPDNTVVDPGKKFTKTWRIMNNGTCTWSTSYVWTFDSGDQMSGANTPLPASVAPGATLDISVNLVAPTTTGTYKGVWTMHNASGQAFGFVKPWVQIKVGTSGPTATAGPSPTASVTPTEHSGILIIVTATKSGGGAMDSFTVSFSDSTSTPDCIWNADQTQCSLSVKKGWSGTISLSKGKWTFDPASKTFKDVQSDQYYNATAK